MVLADPTTIRIIRGKTIKSLGNNRRERAQTLGNKTFTIPIHGQRNKISSKSLT